MEMKSRAVKLFCAIAESGSLLAASNKLNLSSSAASRMLSQLEDRLGVKLFERGNKQLVLSEEGNNFYRVAHEAMKAWKVLEIILLIKKQKDDCCEPLLWQDTAATSLFPPSLKSSNVMKKF